MTAEKRQWGSASVSPNDNLNYKIKAAGAEKDIQVCENWKEMWKDVGVTQSMILSNYEKMTMDFISNARELLDYRTFVAEDEKGAIIGSASCQIWDGPQPNVIHPNVSKIGTMWAVFVKPKFRRQGVATALVEQCIAHWQKIGCTQAVLLYASEEGKRVYQRLGFTTGPMLAFDISSKLSKESCNESETGSPTFDQPFKIVSEGPDADFLVADHYRRLLLDSGFAPHCLNHDMFLKTLKYMKDARTRLSLRSFVAYDTDEEAVASVCCQVWEGPLPLVLHASVLKFGSIWGLFIKEGLETELIGSNLVMRCVKHLHTIACTKVLTLCPNTQLRKMLETQCSFEPSNAMVLDLQNTQRASTRPVSASLPYGVTTKMIDQLRNSIGNQVASDQELAWLLAANHNQLKALDLADNTEAKIVQLQKENGLWVDPEDNWFTKNVARLGGGFDLKLLSQNPDLLATKFDRLAKKYDEWTLGNCSRIESWVAQVAQARLIEKSQNAHVMDVCCGTGLMGQMLRLCGFKGLLTGFDISPEMLSVAATRQCYNFLEVANANNGINLPDNIADIILCTGAMELLDTEIVVGDFSRLLRSGGELWVSFQADSGEDGIAFNPTSHQNVHGMNKNAIVSVITGAGFKILEIEHCATAFFTPSPAIGDGKLFPVPYYLMCCQKP